VNQIISSEIDPGSTVTKPKNDSSKEGNDIENNFWIFHANPRYYNLSAAIIELREMKWEVNQYKKEIHKGDRVFLWEAGKNAGVVCGGPQKLDNVLSSGEHDERSAA
jgi:hypothetical protein